MKIKFDGHGTTMVAAALWLCLAGPMRATESDARAPEPAAESSDAAEAPAPAIKAARHRVDKKTEARSRKPDKNAARPIAKADDHAGDKADDKATIPDTVANANAQYRKDAPTDMGSMSAQADAMLKLMGSKPATVEPAPATQETPAIAVSADQLNEMDRALTPEKPVVRVARPTAEARVVIASDHSVWTETSLIGKVFMAFGGLLTMASAVRMFVA
ncbi:MAG: hypothetical protein H7312_18020 [Tardiphaga sp.]|nr:hypothetical protein [Tardiphaga sp.]